MKKNHLIALVYFIWFWLPVLSMINCGWWNEGSMSANSCFIDIFGIFRFIASFFYGILFLSIWTFWLPLLGYMLYIFTMIGVIHREKDGEVSMSNILRIIFVFIGGIGLVFFIIAFPSLTLLFLNKFNLSGQYPWLLWVILWLFCAILAYFYIAVKKREKQTLQEAPKETKKVNQKIASVDIGGTKLAVFSFLGGKVIKVNSVDLIKVAKVVIAQTNKNTFAPGELREIYAKIHDNYESQLDPETFKKLADLLKQFVEEGGEISFE